MHGSGYNLYNQMQHRANQEAQDCLLRAAEALSGSAESVLIADYGSSASANSALLLAPVVQCLAAKQVSITVAHVDLPENDWQGLQEATQSREGTYLQMAPDVNSQACAQSFYSQCFPAASVSLAWSAPCITSLTSSAGVGDQWQ
ncbi:hypothetical protein WJX84_010139 [Apatococcus fuscideae]|uniref:Uncharacterized protein n=1 Tax=Apatococcus fuscideae TaxID=2026836 RepID=A0AAW1TE20_9CHLO